MFYVIFFKISYIYLKIIYRQKNLFSSTFTEGVLDRTIFLIRRKFEYSVMQSDGNNFYGDSLFIFLVLNAVFITVYHVKSVQDDISAKTVPIWLHHTATYIVDYNSSGCLIVALRDKGY